MNKIMYTFEKIRNLGNLFAKNGKWWKPLGMVAFLLAIGLAPFSAVAQTVTGTCPGTATNPVIINLASGTAPIDNACVTVDQTNNARSVTIKQAGYYTISGTSQNNNNANARRLIVAPGIGTAIDPVYITLSSVNIQMTNNSALTIGAGSYVVITNPNGGQLSTSSATATHHAISIEAGANVSMKFEATASSTGMIIQNSGGTNAANGGSAINIASSLATPTTVNFDFTNCLIFSSGGNTSSTNDAIFAGPYTNFTAKIAGTAATGTYVSRIGNTGYSSRLFAIGNNSTVDLTIDRVLGYAGTQTGTIGGSSANVIFHNNAIEIGQNSTVNNLTVRNTTFQTYTNGTNTLGRHGILINPNVNAKVTLNGASFTSTTGCAFYIDRASDVELTLEGTGVNTLQSGIRSVTSPNFSVSYAGLFVHPGDIPFNTSTPWNNTGLASVTIKGTGRLDATGGNTGGNAGSNNNNSATGAGAGIGGNGFGKINDNGSGGGGTESNSVSFGGNSGTITIEGGIINAKGGGNTAMLNGGTGAGIGGGGGWRTNGGNTVGTILIKCGDNAPVVTATGGQNTNGQANNETYGGGGGAGIGGGGAGITGKRGGSNLGGIYIQCGTVTAQGGGTNSTSSAGSGGHGAGGAGIGGGGAFHGDFGGFGNYPRLLVISPGVVINPKGGAGDRGTGSDIGNGGRSGDPVISNITPLKDLIEIYRPMAKGQEISMSASIQDPQGPTKFEWYVATGVSAVGTRVGETNGEAAISATSTYKLGDGDEFTTYPELDELYYYCVVICYDYSGQIVKKSMESPDRIKVVLQEFKKPLLLYYRNGQEIPKSELLGYVTGFTPVQDPYSPETITISIVNAGNIPWLEDYDLSIVVKSDPYEIDNEGNVLTGEQLLAPINTSGIYLGVGGEYPLHVTSIAGKSIGGSPYYQRINISSELKEDFVVDYGVSYDEDVTITLQVVLYLVSAITVTQSPKNPYNNDFPNTWYEGQPFVLDNLQVRLDYPPSTLPSETVDYKDFVGQKHFIEVNATYTPNHTPVINGMRYDQLYVKYGSLPLAYAAPISVIPTAQVIVYGGTLIDTEEDEPLKLAFPGGNRYEAMKDITVVADPDEGGKVFSHWEFVKVDGDEENHYLDNWKNNPKLREYTFQLVPAHDLVIRAVFIYNIKYNVSGDGEIVEIKITDPTDEDFVDKTIPLCNPNVLNPDPPCSFEVEAGRTFTFTAELNVGKDPDNYRAEWKVTQNNNTLTPSGEKVGNQYILSRVANANATVSLKFIECYTVKFNVDGTGGSIVANARDKEYLDGEGHVVYPVPFDITSGQYVDADKIIDFTAIPSSSAYRIAKWEINGVPVQDAGEFIKDGSITLILSELKKHIEVTVTFENVQHTITFGVDGGNGTLGAAVYIDGVSEIYNTSGEIIVSDNAKVLFKTTPAANYRVQEWKVDGNEVIGNRESTFELSQVTQDAIVKVKFIDDAYWVVTFVVEDVVHDEKTVVKTPPTAVTPPAAPTRSGETFIGWYTAGNIYWNFNTFVTEDMYLYAKFTPTQAGKFFVTFNFENGDEPYTEWVEANKTVNKPDPDPVRSGYTFMGWLSSNGLWDFNAPVTRDLVLMAYWVPQEEGKFTVTYIYNDDATPPNSIQVNANDKLIKPTNPVRTGWAFTGWYNGDIPWVFDTPVTGNMILMAHWEKRIDPDTYAVTFEYRDGISASTTIFVDIDTPVAKPQDPTRKGFIFNGWYTELDVLWVFTDNVTEDMFLHAGWISEQPDKYAVTFVYNDGQPMRVEVVFTEKNTPVAKPDAPVREGYAFTGWYTESGAFWNFDDDIKWDMFLYARWVVREDPNTYAVTFVYYDNKTQPLTIFVQKDTKIDDDQKPADPTKDGYAFTGWNGEQGITWNFVTPVTGDMFLYAGWKERTDDLTFLVTFVYNDGVTPSETVPVPILTPVTKPAIDPVREHFEFKGWFTESDDEWIFTSNVVRDMRLYAKWEQIDNPGKHAVTFINNGVVLEVQFVDPNGKATKPPVDPTRTGYVFTGWYTESGAYWNFNTSVTREMFLYAGWKERPDPNSVAVIFVYDNGINPQTVFVPKSTPVAKPADPVKAGYAFTGWYTEANGIWNFAELVENDMFLNAGWFERPEGYFVVTFVSNDDANNTISVLVPENEVIGAQKPADPVKTKYAFTGWFTESGVDWDFNIPVSKDLFLYAGWKLRIPDGTFAVTFHYNDGGVTDPKTEFVLENEPVTEPITPVRTGFTFVEWQTGAGVKWIFTDKVMHDMSLYAVWKSNYTGMFAVTFIYDDGATSPQTALVTENTPVDKPDDPAKEGFIFTGWYDESGLIWNFKNNVSREMTLRAGWIKREPGTFAVIFVYNDNLTNPFIVITPENKAISKPIDPVREGYAFTGWYTESGYFWNFATPVSKDLFLYAGWLEREEGKYAVTFVKYDDANGTETIWVIENTAIVTTAIPADPTKTGYTFTGWHTESGANWNFANAVTADMFLYAGWVLDTDKEGKFSVTFIYNDTDTQQEFVIKYKPVTRPVDPVNSDSDYAFTGWYDESGSIWDFTAPVERDMFLRAGWIKRDPGTFAVVFVYNDKTTQPSIVFVTENSAVTRPEDPARSGYAFTGWYTESPGVFWNFKNPVAGDMFLYAEWLERPDPNDVAVTFVFDDAANTVITEFITKNTVIGAKKPADPTKTGYAFTGWYTESGNFWNFETPVSKDMFLYAGWKLRVPPGSIAVTFVYDDGVTPPLTKFVASASEPVVAPATPTRAGFTFTGWYTEAGVEWIFSTPVGSSDMFLYAGWDFDDSATKYFVTFILNDGTDQTFTEFVTHGEAVTEPAKPEREGYAFTGWYDESGSFWNFSGKVNRNMFLTARWIEREPGTFAVTFVFNDEATNPRTVLIPENTKVVRPLDPTRDGYAFTGWYTESGLFWNFDVPVTGDLFLYARWEKRPDAPPFKYAVNFVYLDGVTDTKTVFVEENKPIPAIDQPAEPVRTGFKFTGWFTDSDLKWNYAYLVTEDIFLYAGWETEHPGTFAVTFNYYEAEVKTSQTIFVPKNTAIGAQKPADPTRDDYAFTGWYDESGTFWNMNHSVTRDMILTAGWIVRTDPESFAVTFVYENGYNPKTVFVPENTPVAKPADPVKTGYAFTGWYTESDGIWNFANLVEKDMILIAGWVKREEGKFAVTFVYNNDDNTTLTVLVPENEVIGDQKPADPAKTGYAFTGWYAESGAVWEFDVPVSKDMFLYAGWKEIKNPNRFAVTFYFNDGVNNPRTELVLENTPVIEPLNPVRTGFTFEYWQTGSGVEWNFADDVTHDLSLFAKWISDYPSDQFAVTFIYDDGATSPVTVIVSDGSPVDKPADPVKDGYLFTGWYDESGSIWNFDHFVKRILTLKAGWVKREEGKFGVIFVYNDDLTNPHIVFVKENTPVAKPINPVREGYAFTGWYTESGSFWNFATPVSTDLFLYAGWIARPPTPPNPFQYAVTFVKYDDANAVETIWVLENTPIDSGDIPADPTKTGYTFTGWFTEADQKWNFAANVTRDMLLYAGWELETIHLGEFSVTFNYNDDATNPTTATIFVPENTVIGALKPANPTRSGHAFTGWYDESGYIWDFTDPVSRNMTLSAGWEKRVDPDTYAVIFVYRDKVTDPTIVFVEKTKAVAKPADPVRSGYAFVGWYTEEKDGDFWNFETVVPGDMFLYAHWEERIDPDTYSVTFVFDNGDPEQTEFITKNTVIGSKKPADPVKTGYAFTGWYTESGDFWNFDTFVTKDMFLYAGWEERPTVNHVLVTFVYNDDANKVVKQFITRGSQITKPADPTKTGYEFTYWETASGSEWIFSTPVTDDMFLYAGWVDIKAPNTFVVTFDYKDGVTENKSEIVDLNTPVARPVEPSRAGYAFTGWYDESGAYWNFNKNVSRDMYLSAHWAERVVPGTVAVTFVNDDGVTHPRTVFISENTPVIKPVDPVRNGYAFTGWYTESGSFWNFDVPVGKDLILVAKWEERINPDTYAVTFVKYDDANETQTVWVAKNKAVAEIATPTKTGFTLVGWLTESGSKWNFSYLVKDDMFLYADWEPNNPGTFAVTFDYNDGATSSITKFVRKNAAMSKPVDPSRVGYAFTGWYTESGAYWNFSNPVTRDMYLTAHWVEREDPNTFAVTFVFENGLNPVTVFVDKNTVVTKPVPDPVRDGYAFTGWNAESGVSWDFDIPVTGDMILIAGWEKRKDPNTWGVTFIYNNGVTPSTTVFIKDNEPVTKPQDPERKGFKFVQWNDESGVEWIFSKSITKDMRLYAKWESEHPDMFAVTFINNSVQPAEVEVSFVTKYTPVTMPQAPSRAGYAFTGWYTESGAFWIFNDNVERDMFLYAGWVEKDDPNTYAVTFVPDNGLNPYVVFVKNDNNTQVAKPNPHPVKDGFAFAGWNRLSGISWDFSIPVTGDMILVAGWVERDGDKLGVTFIYNDGVTAATTVFVEKGGYKVTKPQNPERKGFIFNRWNDESGVEWNFSNNVTDDMLLYAVWDREVAGKYVVTFVYSEETPVKTEIVLVDFNTPVDKPANPVREGYAFTGWYTESGAFWNFGQIVERDMILYAGWIERKDPNTFAVTFVFNNGLTPKTVMVKSDEPVDKPTDPARENYAFAGWYTEWGLFWNFSLPVNKDMFLYAEWEERNDKNTYSVTFVYNDGFSKATTVFVEKNKPVTEPSEKPVREGFTFDRWNDEDGDAWNFATGITSDMFLYAGWKSNDPDPTKLAVTFINNAVKPAHVDVVFVLPGTSVEKPSNPVRTGYAFTGWHTESGAVWDFNQPVTREMFLYAGWEERPDPDKYAVTFVYYDDLARTQTVFVPKDTPVDRPDDPAKDGYAFTGWNAESGITWDFSVPVTGDMFLYASWVKRPTNDLFAVTFVYKDGVTPSTTEFVSNNGTTKVSEPEKPTREGFAFDAWYDKDGTKWNFETNPVTSDMFLYAEWLSDDDLKWAVTFVYNKDELPAEVEVVFVEKNTPVEKPDTPFRLGYAFTGWYTESDAFWDFEKDVTRDMFLYAGWKKRPDGYFAVTFVYNDEGNNTITVLVREDTPVEEPNAPAKNGYVFTGWYTDIPAFWDFNTPVTKDLFLHAGWEPRVGNHWGVTFVYNDGVNKPTTIDIADGQKISKPADPSRGDGFTFTGWFVDSKLTTKWDFNAPVHGDMFLYAGWSFPEEDIKYFVTFVKNDGTLYFETVFVLKDTPVNRPTTPDRTGYVFQGWYNESGSYWNFDDRVTRNMFLYAMWKKRIPQNFGVTFVFDKTRDPLTVFVLENTAVNKPEPDPVKEEHMFAGWYTEAGELWDFSTLVTQDIILVAKWAPYGKYAVTFVYNNGRPQETVFVTSDNNSKVARPVDPVKTGFVFTGWYTDDNFLWDFADPVTQHMLLNANWYPDEIGKYAVTFAYNNGKLPETVYVDADNLTPVQEPEVPVREGYIFLGWFTEDGYYWYFSTPITNHITLSAKWTPVGDDYAVTFIYSDGVTANKTVRVKNDNLTTVPRPEDPVRTDYIFTGWYTVSDFLWDFTAPVTKHMLLIAKWVRNDEPDKYAVTFVYNDGVTKSETKYVVVNTPVDRPADPKRNGYIFTGWYTEDNQLWIFTNPIPKTMLLVAHWISDGSYKVTFIYNDSGITDPKIEYVNNDNQSIVPRPDNPVWNGWIFIGWYTDQGMLWNFRDPVKSDMLLNAKWIEDDPNTYAVTFIFNDGVTMPETKRVLNNNLTPVARPYPDPSRDGYAFIGWFTENEKYWDFNIPITGHMLLVAKWYPVGPGEVVVTFIANDSDHPITYQVFLAGQPATELDPLPVRENYVIEGWYKNGNYAGSKWNFSDPVNEHTILIARWFPYHTITFSVEGGNGDLKAMVDGGVYITSGAQVHAGSIVFFIATPDAGYTIQKWTDNGLTVNGKESPYFIQNLASDHHVRVFFEPSQELRYTVTVDSEGAGASGEGTYMAGVTVNIKAGAAPEGKRFLNWTTESSKVTFSDATSINTSFVMPDENVTVKANFVGILDFEMYVVVKWNNTLMLNIYALRTGGENIIFANTDICEWYRDGILIHTGATYSAGLNQVLTVGATYMFKIVTSQGTYFSTPYKHTPKSAIAFAYPNPVRSGDMITVEGVEEGSVIQVFSHVGTLVSQFIATGETTTLTLNVTPGMYVLRTTNGDVKMIIE